MKNRIFILLLALMVAAPFTRTLPVMAEETASEPTFAPDDDFGEDDADDGDDTGDDAEDDAANEDVDDGGDDGDTDTESDEITPAEDDLKSMFTGLTRLGFTIKARGAGGTVVQKYDFNFKKKSLIIDTNVNNAAGKRAFKLTYNTKTGKAKFKPVVKKGYVKTDRAYADSIFGAITKEDMRDSLSVWNEMLIGNTIAGKNIKAKTVNGGTRYVVNVKATDFENRDTKIVINNTVKGFNININIGKGKYVSKMSDFRFKR